MDSGTILGMDITKLTSSDLKSILKLTDKKEALLAQIKEIDAKLAGFGGNTPAKSPKAAVSKPAKKASRKRRSKVNTKDAAIAVLQAAGKQGLHVKDVAAKAGLNLKSLTVWFYTKGKSIKEIKKVGPQTYAWVG